jgi:dTDP-4-amino-4,6-dideoxygalactose transaminase
MKQLENLPIVLPTWKTEMQSVWHLFVVQVENRDYVRGTLAKAGIETGIHYPIPPHLQLSYKKEYGMLPLLRAEKLSKSALSLPIGPHLSSEMTKRVVDVLCETVNN